MNEIKVYNQDGLIYFDNFRIKELILLKNQENDTEYLVMIDIQTYDYCHTESDITVLEQKFHQRIHNQLNYVWIKFEEFCDLKALKDLDSYEFEIEENEDKYLYFGSHVFLSHNRLKIERNRKSYRIAWEATSDDAIYYDAQTKENSVEINCDVDLYVFNSKEDWQKHDKLRNRQRDCYFDILNQLQGTTESVKKELDISEIKPGYSEKKKNELAWKIALDRIQE